MIKSLIDRVNHNGRFRVGECNPVLYQHFREKEEHREKYLVMKYRKWGERK